MDYRDLLKNIEAMEASYLFKGEEEYLIDHTREEIVKRLINPETRELNYVNLDGGKLDLKSLIEACETLPFMSDKKLITVNNLGELDKLLDIEKLISYLEELGDYLVLIFIDEKNQLNKNSKFYRFFSRKKRNVDFPRLKAREFDLWVERYIKKSQREISRSDLAYLIDQLAYSKYGSEKNLYEMDNELKKIIAGSEDLIEKSHIDRSLTIRPEDNVFDLLDSLMMRDINKAMIHLKNLEIQNEDLTRIFYMIGRQYRLLYGIKSYKSLGYGESQIREKLSIGAFEYKKLSRLVGSFDFDELEDNTRILLEMDKKQKTTSIDEVLLMELLLTKLICKDK